MLPFELPEQTPEQTIPAQLALCGFSPEDVGTLVMSHLHFDHVGGNRHLPDARVLVHAREIAQGRACEPFERLGYSDRAWDHERARLVPITGDRELAAGLHLCRDPRPHGRPLSLPGHARERLDHAVPRSTSSTRPTPTSAGSRPGFHIDPVAGVRSIARIRALAEEHGAEIFFTHDMDAWGTYRHAPDFYEV